MIGAARGHVKELGATISGRAPRPRVPPAANIPRATWADRKLAPRRDAALGRRARWPGWRGRTSCTR